MKRCAFLTCRNLEGYVHDDHLAVPCFARSGWEVSPVVWDDAMEWTQFDAVLIRTPWDYTQKVDQFLAVVEEIERVGVQLWNSASTVRWNARKTYLFELEGKGIPIVPTLLSSGRASHAARVREAFERFECSQLIIKPIVGAGASGIQTLQSEIEEIASAGPVLVQPFLSQIMERGELSLIFFERELSHTVRKMPKPGDFRSQEEYGSRILLEKPPSNLIEAARNVLSCLSEVPLYSRVDLIESSTGLPLVMELELIEPSLYFRADDGAAKRFVDAFVARYAGNFLE